MKLMDQKIDLSKIGPKYRGQAVDLGLQTPQEQAFEKSQIFLQIILVGSLNLMQEKSIATCSIQYSS